MGVGSGLSVTGTVQLAYVGYEGAMVTFVNKSKLEILEKADFKIPVSNT